MDESHVRCCAGADRTCEKVKACRESSGDFHLYLSPALQIHHYHSTCHFSSHDTEPFLPQKARIKFIFYIKSVHL